MEPIRTDTKARRSLRDWVLIGVGGGVALILGGVLLVVVYLYAKEWRAHSLVEKAKIALTQPQTAKQGISELMAAFHLAPDDPVVVRGLADFQARSRNGVALALYHKLLGLPGISREDQRAAARGFMAFGDLKTAHDTLDGLMSNQPEADDYALQGELDWANHDQADAVASIRKAVSMAPTISSNRLLLAQFLVLMPGYDERSEGASDLKSLAAQSDEIGLQALETLCQVSGLDATDQRWALEQLSKHPLLDDAGRLAGWGLEKQLKDPDAVFKEVVEFFTPTSAERRSLAARWLYTQGKPDLALELATPETALTNQDLFLCRMDCLAFEKKWSDVAQELNSDRVPLSPTLIHIYRARAAHELGDDTKSATEWDRAREAALSEPGLLNYVSSYALQIGMFDEAKKTFIQETHIPQLVLPGFQQLLKLEQTQGTDADLMDTLNQMLTTFPADPEVRNDWAYMSLLLNQNLPQAAPIAQSLVDAAPNLLTYRTTLALCYLRQNDPAGAMTVYQGLSIDWNSAPLSGRCIYAATLAANNRKEDAAAVIKRADLSQLRPAERDFLKKWNLIPQ